MPTKMNAGRQETEFRRRSRRSSTKSMTSYPESPALRQRLSLKIFKLSLELGGTEDSEGDTKGNVKNVLANLPSNSSNKASKCPGPKEDARVTCTGEKKKKKNHLMEGQTMITRNERKIKLTVCLLLILYIFCIELT